MTEVFQLHFQTLTEEYFVDGWGSFKMIEACV